MNNEIYAIPDRDYKVVIICGTYNHELYIENALKGFVRQETNFPYCALVIDDCSTDHNADIIREYEKKYPDIIKGVYLKENYYSQKKSKDPIRLPWIEHAQYVAYCEGDDYWISDNKLQLQVDFLDNHPDYMLHFHNAIRRYQNTHLPDEVYKVFESGDFNTEKLFATWSWPTASVVLRKEVLLSDVYKEMAAVEPIDLCLFAASTCLGKVYGLSECHSVYRIHNQGITNFLGAQFAIRVNYSIAKITADPGALKVMERRTARDLTGLVKPYFLRDPYAVSMVRLADSFNKRAFYLAMWNYIKSIPSRFLRKLGIIR